MNQEKDTSQKSEISRKVAKKVFIGDILSSTYIKRPGWEPSGILTKYGEVSRVNICGAVVSIMDENNGSSLLLDDGTGSLTIRSFEQTNELNRFSLGELINVIGKPREGPSGKYVVPEIITKIKDKRWYDLHHMEVKLQKKTESIKLPVDVETESQEETIEIGPYQKILNSIAILDKGQGADIEDIIKNVKIDRCEKIITALIEEGEIFEVSPGKVKLLE